MRVLVIDSNPEVRTWASRALEARGYSVITASGVREGYALLTLCDIDGVVLDLFLPERRAHDLLRALRSNTRLRPLPVLLLGPSDASQERIGGLLVGANDFLTKPAEAEELVRRVERMVVQQSASPGGLFGRLSDTDLLESLQALQQEQGSGVVRIFGDKRDGWIELDGGRLATARYGLLEGWSAMLALLTLSEGHFHFEPRPAGEPGPEPAMGPAYSLPSLELRLAQARDRLRRFRVHLPSPETSLEICGSLDPELAALEDTPYAEIYERISALPGLTLAELLDHELAPELHLKLALAILIKTSVIAPMKTPGKSVHT